MGDKKFFLTFDSVERTLKGANLLSSTLLWCCLFFNFQQFVILENLSLLHLALSRVKGLTSLLRCTQT